MALENAGGLAFLVGPVCLDPVRINIDEGHLAEELLKAEGKGAVATFSPSGLSLNNAAHVFHRALLEELLEGGHTRLGDAVMAAQSAYADSGALPEMIVIYHLFGDPALRLR